MAERIRLEEQYIAGQFRKNFSGLKNKKIALYGISRNTEAVLKGADGYQIIGLLDGFYQQGELYGRQLLSFDEAAKAGTEAIVIIARAGSAKVIFARIKKLCERYGIQVYDFKGNRMDRQEEICPISNPYWERSFEEMKCAVEQYSVIRFEIFETLVMRQTPVCNDSSQITEKEWESEKKGWIPRDTMCRIYRYAYDKNKRIEVVSDGRHSKEQVRELMEKLDLKGFDRIVKGLGEEREKVREVSEEMNEEVFHDETGCLFIGTSYGMDTEEAMKDVAKIYLIKNGLEMLKISSWNRLLMDMQSPRDKIKTGIVVSEVCNDPFALHDFRGRFKISKAYDIGYVLIAPIVTDFMLWLVGQLQKDQPDVILFLARDGYLIRKLYHSAVERMKRKRPELKLPEDRYFLASRKVCIGAALYRKEDIMAASLGFQGSVRELLAHRFGVKDIKGNSLREDVRPFYDPGEVLEYKDDILKRAESMREGYQKYIAGQRIDNAASVAVFDFVASGSCQLGLERILKKKLKGYYFLRVNDGSKDKLKLDIEALFDTGNALQSERNIYENYFFLENFITSEEPTLEDFSTDGTPIYMSERRSQEELQFVKEVQTGICDYFDAYLELESEFDGVVDTRVSDRMLDYIHAAFTQIDSKILKQMVLQDEFYNRSIAIKNLI